MAAISASGIDRKRLRNWLSGFLLALALPSGLLICQAFGQLKWQSFYQHRILAEEFAARIDSNLRGLIAQEEARPFGDYQFLIGEADAAGEYLQRSPLSGYPPVNSLPGAIGYFQVDPEGRLSTPLLPGDAALDSLPGISEAEFAERSSHNKRIRAILSRNKLVGGAKRERVASPLSIGLRDQAAAGTPEPAAAAPPELKEKNVAEGRVLVESNSLSPAAQAGFDQLNSPARRQELRQKKVGRKKQNRIADYPLDYSLEFELAREKLADAVHSKSSNVAQGMFKQRERTAAPEQEARADLDSKTGVDDEVRIHTFESAAESFEFSLLDSGHFVLYRKIWREGRRFVQGILIDQAPFLDGMVNSAFAESSLSAISDLIIAYQGDVYSEIRDGDPIKSAAGIPEFSGSVLYQTRLASPLNDFELVFSVTELPLGAGADLIVWVAIVLGAVLLGGFALIYRTGLLQIKSAEQQRNFVSAISHELKTPLTSIRMYSEMLREGWAPEEKKISYYQYILSESERLTRLINNVLQLAKLGRDEFRLEVTTIPVAGLIEEVEQKVRIQTERAGFELKFVIAPELEQEQVEADRDALIQIFINLVDNAIKFSRDSNPREIEFACRREMGQRLRFSVRDYGPGIAPNQMKKIFRLFYRAENELTRETVGTGIGLALVSQLAGRMQAQVDVVNRFPGAEFRITIPLAAQTSGNPQSQNTAKAETRK